MGYCIAETSLAHTYGNVTCFITEYIKNLFDPKYFKTIHISSTIAYKQFNIFQNTNKEFLKKNKPMLIIRPRIELNNSDAFMYDTLLTTRITDNYMETCFTNLQDFIHDCDKGISMKFLLNRLRMLFDVTIITETQIEQINKALFLKNRIRWDKPFFLDTCLESYIPRDLMRLTAESAGMTLYDHNGSTKPFLDYINTYSIFPVTYKIKNSSGNDEFFRFYPVHIDTSFNDLNIDDGNKRGMVADSHSITFTVSTEFWSTGLYYLFTRKENHIDKLIMNIKSEDDNKIIPIYTISNLYDERIADGWNLYSSNMYNVDSNKGPDIMDISTIFNYSIRKLIEDHLSKGIPIKTFMIPIVMKDGIRLVEGRDFHMDYDNLQLITHRCNMDSTYRLVIHINTLYINTMLKDIFDLEKEK